MTTITIRYEGCLHTIAVHDSSGSTLQTDAPLDNGGKGETFSPTDLVGTALGSCIATVMALYADRHNINLQGMVIHVEKTMSTTLPRRIARLNIVIQLPSSFSQEVQDALLRVAKNCPVHHSLHPDIELIYSLQK